MRAILLLIIGLNIILVAAASGEENSITLKWGESASFPPYNITAVDFSPGTVEEHPEICNNGTWYNDEHTTNYVRTSYGCNDYVFLNVSRDGSHVMDALLSKVNRTIGGAEFTNETTYEDNEGSIKIGVLDITSGYYITTPSVSLDITIVQNVSTELDIVNNLTITKVVPDPANVFPSYPFIPVTIAIENIGKLNFSYIRMVDEAGDGFVSEPQDLKWSISLHSGELWQAQYLIKPQKPTPDTEYTLPPATLYIVFGNKTYNLSTGNISFTLRSSDIILSKTADRVVNNVTVNLSLKNNGSRAALVKVWDSLPPGTEIINGEMNFSRVLQPGDFYNNSYMLKLNDISDNISLPPAKFTFKEYKPGNSPEANPQGVQNITGSGMSNPAEITFAKPASADVHATSTDNSASSSIENPKNTSGTPGFFESIVAELKNIPAQLLKMLGGAGKTSGQTAPSNQPAYSGGD
ncbi:Uncharacterised protein [uncultured archaeon]|nr:Uncharacterised protein [uncultured archaeon]